MTGSKKPSQRYWSAGVISGALARTAGEGNKKAPR